MQLAIMAKHDSPRGRSTIALRASRIGPRLRSRKGASSSATSLVNETLTRRTDERRARDAVFLDALAQGAARRGQRECTCAA